MMSSIARTLERAFAVHGARAVALLINSPGGSPAQSHLIYGRIRQLAEEKKLPVYAFIEDVGASGGYMLACAGDEIICDPYAIVGSIGVIGGSFGFVDAIQKLGIERRIYTSGERKAMLDPFLPEKPDDVARIHALQTDIHAHFIQLVKTRRGARLNGSDETLFSGEFWVADRAIELGLADRIGDVRSEMRRRYGEKVKLQLIEGERSWIGRQLPGVMSGAQIDASPDALISAIEARALWSRFGL
jgi:signal peptide peptidase SppA